MYYDQALERARRGTLVGQVFGLLAFSLVFTAGGAVIGRALGPAALLLSIVGSIGCLIALFLLRARPAVGLGLFYAFSVFEGMALGLIIESYVARGMGSVVINAATTTAGLTLALGAYAWTTKRDLSGMAGYLSAALIAVIVAGLVGIFFQSPLFYLLLSAVTAILFSGFVMYDIQRLKYAEQGEGNAVMMAVSIYLDIFNLFLAILRIFGFLSGGDED
ncbi:MAG TPA: Bax inhibitor-1/YccA family protein [Chloroflexota bacterium]|nr:Bax inhibitor-1/YccA family protein [Chloroflexota bacterium]